MTALIEVPCVGCQTPVRIYPPEDGDGPVSCGRCSGTALAVVHDRVSTDLREAVEQRLAERVADASRRRAERERARREKDARRTAGLRARHAAKLARERGTS
ncbi:hypothetical protein [Actinomadura chokoriensis]|uniref:hypothetical protein n=1 Tax=Actinomadura chokoriensis TaxID=454156 RepID=UPI0031F979BD